ncbi:hypothetical protein ES703_85900 [subsurface metagenome]
MPQCYTDGGDTMQDLGWDFYAAQSFTPLTTHILHYIDLELDTVHPTRLPSIWIYLADGNHKPTGSVLSYNIRHTAKRNIYQNPFRARNQMSPYELQAETEYVIVVHAFALDLAWYMRWQYNKTDSEYPRGIRLISTDGGNTWAERPNDDHMFCEFGDPPTPPPPPEPPIPLFFILKIQQIRLADGFKIIVTTNVPCHLWMRWTVQEPRVHSKPVYRRGIQMHTDVYFCFTVYTDNEQQEPGDTIIHTFIKRDWPVCETRYFYFTGTIDGEPIPSTTAIFSKHAAPLEAPPAFTLAFLDQYTILPDPPVFTLALDEHWW